MEFVTGLRCIFCGGVFPPQHLTCPRCGIHGILDVEYDYPAIANRLARSSLEALREWSHWRYRELLPVGADSAVPEVAVGWTPLTSARALARHIGIRELLLKDDGRNPTASLKDRASSVGVAKAVESGQRIIACASTGNAASSCAGMAASMGIRSVIFVPWRAPQPKVTQLLIFGATVFRVRGSYDHAFQLCQQACERWGWYNRNSGINPYLMEGKKTAGLEIAEQLSWDVPDWLAVSVGDGCTIAGVWKAFRELKALGWIDRTPRMLGVQAEGAAPVTESFRTSDPPRKIEPQTLADSIAVGVPRNWKKAVTAVRESGGAMINTSDCEILEAMKYTGRLAGVFAEPAAAAAVAGLRAALVQGIVEPDSRAVALITGNGLKDIQSAASAAGAPFEIDPDGSGLDQILEGQELTAPCVNLRS